jgi:hypothetical protein
MKQYKNTVNTSTHITKTPTHYKTHTLVWYKNNKATYNIVRVTNSKEMMLHTIHAAVSYVSSNPQGRSPSSQVRPTISQSMEDRLATWNKNRCREIHL